MPPLSALAASLPVTEASLVVLALGIGLTVAWLAHLFADRRRKPA